jgi:hypothetical protein
MYRIGEFMITEFSSRYDMTRHAPLLGLLSFSNELKVFQKVAKAKQLSTVARADNAR